MKLQRYNKIFLLVTALLLAACSSGGGDDGDIVGTGEKPKTIVGTAAVGAPISQAPLAAKSRNGNKVNETTGNNGKYSLTIPSTGSVLLKVDAGNGKTLYSIAGDSGTTNIHPFTDLVVRNWFKVQGLDIDAEFASDAAFTNLPTPQEVNDIKAAIRSLIAQALIQQGLPADFDLISSDFDANGQGFDQFLDFSLVVIINNNFTISLTDPVTDVENEIVSHIDLATDLTLPDNEAPTMPENLRAVPASATDIVVVWDPSSDNIGVAGYNVYRNGELVATTPYPVYTDTGLVGGTDYCYAVEALDGAGTLSPQATTPPPCAQTTAADNTPPNMPTALAATSQGPNTISLTWIQSGINDVVAFDIYRGPVGSITEKVATVTSTAHTDYNLSSDTEYCYQVVARDAAGNTSSASDPACATTDVGTNPLPAGDSFISFSSATYQATETGAVAVITVNRSGDNTAAASVDYSTSDGTATAEQDYTPVSGVLSWGTLDNAPKTIRIPIQPDLVSDDNETILLTLSNFTNTSAGATTSATVTISDAACPGVLDSDVTTSTTISQCTVVTGNITVSGGVLTISPGVTLMFESSSSLDISATGALAAVGTADLPILFTGVNKTPGSWGGVDFRYTNNVSNALDYLTIEYGGDSATSANLTTTATSSSITRLAISNTTLRNGLGYGLSIAPFTNLGVNGLSNVVITGNGEYPVAIPANLIGYLDPNSDYTGNGVSNDKDEILVITSSSTINRDQTWPSLNVPYLMSSTTYNISAAVTIARGAEFRFPSSSGIDVSANGSLSAIGTVNQPILFTGVSKAPGSWNGIDFRYTNNTNNALDYVTIEYGGASATGANLTTTATSSSITRLVVSNTTLRNGLGYGLSIDPYTNLGVNGLSNVVIKGNGEYPVAIPANLIYFLDPGSDYTGNGVNNDKDEILVVTSSSTVNTDQTWPSLNVPYLMSSTTYNISAAVTIAPGTEFRFPNSSGIDVSANGSLSAIGTVNQPILFTGVNKAPGSWNGIDFRYTNNSNNELDYVTIEYGGDSATGANLATTANSSSITRLTISNTTLRNGFGYGLSIDPYTNLGVNGLSNVLITGNGENPVAIPANLIGYLDPNSDYTGNGVSNDKDEILVITSSSTINRDQTWPSLNVPYLMSNTNYTVSAAVTIAPGAEFRFPSGTGLDVGPNGSLSAIGTLDQPILFTSVNQTPGDWNGIDFRYTDNVNNILDYVVIEFGGGNSTSGGNLTLTSTSSSLTTVTVTNSAFNNSSGYGIVIDPSGATLTSSNNTFSGNVSGDIFGP